MSALNAQTAVETTTAAPSSRVAYLDGIRALAIACVFFMHFGGFWGAPFSAGYIGVDIFFVLSGYIITRILWQRRDTLKYGTFLLSRVRRLYPALLGVVIVGGALSIVVGRLSASDTLVGGAMALTQANSLNVPSGFAPQGPFGVTWSLSAEWISYLILPLVILVVRRFSARRAALVLVACVVVLYGLALLQNPTWFYFGPLSRGAQIFGGGAVALATIGLAPTPRLAKLLPPLAVLSLAGLLLWGAIAPADNIYRYGGLLAVVIAVGLLVTAGSLVPTSGLSVLLSARPLAAIGRASYSFYLWHTIPFVVFAPYVSGNSEPAVVVIYLILAVTATWFSYTYLEKPFMRARSSALVPQGASATPVEPESTKA